MKKNTLMRIASVLLVVVLATTCVISGTFAKYITSVDGTDSVRVAKWGFIAEDDNADNAIVLDNLFKAAYIDNEVHGEDDADIIAPGTTNNVNFQFLYGGDTSVAAPEVAYNFKVECTITGDTTALDANPNFKWKLDGEVVKDAEDKSTAAALIAAVIALSGDASGNKNYAPNDLPDSFYTNADTYAKTHNIGWVWDFETAGAGMGAQDVTDTTMGNDTDLDEITITITITATQIDTLA